MLSIEGLSPNRFMQGPSKANFGVAARSSADGYLRNYSLIFGQNLDWWER